MARRFRFRLETVQRLRRLARDDQRRVVAEAAGAADRAAQRRARWVSELGLTLNESRGAQKSGGLEASVLRRHQQYRAWLQRMIESSGDELTKRRKRLDEERNRLAELSTSLKVIDKLRERQWRRYQTETQREEQSAADEAATQVYLRRQRDDKRKCESVV